MAGFTMSLPGGDELAILESNIQHLQFCDMNFGIKNFVGQGSSAAVYVNVHKGEMVATKKFNQILSKKQILKAANSLVRLRNENIVKFIGYSLVPSALTFEYCHVQLNDSTRVHDLKQLCSLFNDYKYFVIEERLNYMLQAVNGLRYLHKLGIKHRDIKPGNILVNGPKEDICIKLADFNELSHFKETYLVTVTKSAGTTISYLAPEILGGKVESFTFEADIYSLGITIFEVLSDLNSPWEKTLVVCADHLIKEFVLNGGRPDLKLLSSIYNGKSAFAIRIIEHCWSQVDSDRIKLDKLRQQLSIACSQQKRSLRSSSVVIDNDSVAKEYILKDKDPEYIEALYIDNTIGYGVFPKRNIKKGEYIATYIGERITPEEGEKRLQVQGDGDSRGFIYFYECGKRKLCVDATDFRNRVGRFINDSNQGQNCSVRTVMVNEIPYICIFALKEIDKDTELRYNYKDSNLPWRKDDGFRGYRHPLKRKDIQQNEPESLVEIAEGETLSDSNTKPESLVEIALGETLPNSNTKTKSLVEIAEGETLSDSNTKPESLVEIAKGETLSDSNMKPESFVENVINETFCGSNMVINKPESLVEIAEGETLPDSNSMPESLVEIASSETLSYSNMKPESLVEIAETETLSDSNLKRTCS